MQRLSWRSRLLGRTSFCATLPWRRTASSRPAGSATEAATTRRSPGAGGWAPSRATAGPPRRATDALAFPGATDAVAPGALVHDRYRLCERLGAGGFGVVWRAEDQLLRREVALKRIPLPPEHPAPSDREVGLGERAGREALAAARLAHPAIVALYEAYTDDDAVYLISELVHGRTLAQLIAARELDDGQILEIGMALTAALDHAHERGVIHRDVKPQNVLIPDAPSEHDTPAKLTDFGGARLSGEDALTRPGETIGTLAYMAPEQSEGRTVGTPADVYSLALVLYEALTGANPVRGATPAATARRIGCPLPPLRASRSDLPAVLADTLDAALQPDPRERATLPQLRAALERVGAPGQATSATRVAAHRSPQNLGTVPRPVGTVSQPVGTVPQPAEVRASASRTLRPAAR